MAGLGCENVQDTEGHMGKSGLELAIWELPPWRLELKGDPEFSEVCVERSPRA